MKEIETVCRLVKYRSFAEAADDLFCSPSVITNYVVNIEKELCLKLFIRGNKSSVLSLTPEGAKIIPALNQIYLEYQHVKELAGQLNGLESTVLRIGSQPRLGNLPEQEILTSFMINNPEVDLEQVKMTSRELIQLLRSGKLDAAFISVQAGGTVEEYFTGFGGGSDEEIIFLTREDEMYLGISEQYLPGVETEAPFSTFQDFTFAVSFPKSPYQKDSKALLPFETLALKNKFPLKTAFYGANDSTVMKLATEMKIAVTATNIPTQFPGIKFIRVSDWQGYADIYFIYRKSNRKKMLMKLCAIVDQFCAGKKQFP